MAALETRECAESLKRELRPIEPEISDAFVPNCVYRCGCPEPHTCGWYYAAIKKTPALGSIEIQRRYDAYNGVFYGGDNIGENEPD
jgi:hypothetical protein